MNPPESVEDLKKYILREIPKTRFIDFGLLYENDKGEYVVLNDVCMADIRLSSLVYLLVYVSTYCVPIASKQAVPLLYFGHAQIITVVWSLQFFEKIFTFVVLQKTAKKYQHVKYSFRRHVFP